MGGLSVMTGASALAVKRGAPGGKGRRQVYRWPRVSSCLPFLASAGFTPGWHAAQINEADLLANLRAGGRFGFGRFGFLGWRFSFGFLDGHFGCFFRGLGFL